MNILELKNFWKNFACSFLATFVTTSVKENLFLGFYSPTDLEYRVCFQDILIKVLVKAAEQIHL